MTEIESAEMSRDKPRRLTTAAANRIYRLVRHFLPAAWLERRLVNLAWLSRRLALEQIGFARGGPSGLLLTRPHVVDELRAAAAGADRVLDIGGGSGTFTTVLAECCREVVYTDLDEANVTAAAERCAANPNVKLLHADGLSVAESDGPFDLIVMLHVLEHLDAPATALRRLLPCTRSLLIEVPDFASDPLNFVRSSEGLPLHADDDHVIELTGSRLEQLLTESGWSRVDVRPRNGMLIGTATSPG